MDRLDLLREFVVLSQHLSFTAAAKALHISQSTLSTHIAELEREMGVALVLRGRPAALTPAGGELVSCAERLIESYEEVVERCREIAQRDVHELTVVQPVLFDYMPPEPKIGIFNAWRRIEFESPSNHVRIMGVSPSMRILDAVLAGEADCCFQVIHASRLDAEGRFLEGDLAGKAVFSEGPLCCVASPAHPLSGRSVVSVEEISRYPVSLPASSWIEDSREGVKSVFAERGAQITVKLRSAELLIGYFVSVMENDSDVLVNQLYLSSNPMLAPEESAIIPVEGTNGRLFLTAIYRKDNSNPLLTRLLELLPSASVDAG